MESRSDRTHRQRIRAPFAGQLFVFASDWHEGYHIVTRASVERAQAIHDEVEAISSYDTYGELRRAGELEELGDRLSSNYGVDLESYVAAIEDAAGLTGDGGVVPDRLGALTSFDFDGAEIDDTEYPADDEEFRPQHELDNEVDGDNVFMHEIAQSTRSDLPSDLWDEFGETLTPMLSEHVMELIPPKQLASLTSELESRGYLIEHG